MDWNSLVLFAAGAFTAVGSSWLTIRWQRGVAIEAEKREAIRRRREARIEPVAAFLKATRASAGADAFTSVISAVADKASQAGDADSWNWAKKQALKVLEGEASEPRLLEEGTKAVLAAPSKAIAAAIMTVVEAKVSDDPGHLDGLYERLQELEQLVDQYLDASTDK